jgi:hypothetical protein
MHGPPAPSTGMKSWRSRRLPRAALAGGVAFGLAVGGAGIAFAASSSSSTPSTTTPSAAHGPRGPRGFGGAFRGFAGLGAFGGLGSVVHGQATTRTKSGGYQTVDIQLGKVTKVSATSITVASTDGYSHTYVVSASTVVDAQRDGISSVGKADQVDVIATQSGNTATATNIVDMTKVQSSRAGFGFGPGFGGPKSGGPQGGGPQGGGPNAAGPPAA